ncbi:MAG TPA: hypothetical protein DCP75_08190 [Haliea salexigens]|uniref:Uncharacterized protein n=1 Tax=Haliea salexigens TaxID=287487 RepID=A0A3C1KM07_9GAMM|nr:hypothetical protein [Haliea salexigens]
MPHRLALHPFQPDDDILVDDSIAVLDRQTSVDKGEVFRQDANTLISEYLDFRQFDFFKCAIWGTYRTYRTP